MHSNSYLSKISCFQSSFWMITICSFIDSLEYKSFFLVLSVVLECCLFVHLSIRLHSLSFLFLILCLFVMVQYHHNATYFISFMLVNNGVINL